MSFFHQAVKAESKLRLAIAGPSGSGKTYTSLIIASALANGKPIALVDTEHGSASKYADLFSFDVAEMHPPFHPDKFMDAIAEAEKAGYAVVILDSISHAWAGSGGILDIVDEAAKRSKSGNTYMAWKEGTPIQNHLIDAIVQSGIHVIATMRSKTEYVLVDTGSGKQAPKKVGMAPVQRDQFEYEFDVVLDMDSENNGIISKTRCPALTGKVFAKPGKDIAGILSAWLHGAKPTAPQSAPVAAHKPPPAPDTRPLPTTQAEAYKQGAQDAARDPSIVPPVEPPPSDADTERTALTIREVIWANANREPAKAHPEIRLKFKQNLAIAVSTTEERHALTAWLFGSDNAEDWTQGQCRAANAWLDVGTAGKDETTGKPNWAPGAEFVRDWPIVRAAIMPPVEAEIVGK